MMSEPRSVVVVQAEVEEGEEEDHLRPRRLCDFCDGERAVLYCRADTAKLCVACDRRVHSTNPLFRKHTRWLLCDACDSSAAAIFCCTHNSVLCQNCDWEAHKPGPSSSPGLHDRRPLDGFSGCPSVSEILGFFGLDDLGKKDPFFEDGLGADNNGDDVADVDDFKVLDILSWDNNNTAVFSIDELISSCDGSVSEHNFQAFPVAPMPKNRNAVCGRHKDEILHQLREMSKSDPDLKGFDECLSSGVIECQARVPGETCRFRDGDATVTHSNETNAFKSRANENDVTDGAFLSTFLSTYVDTNQLVPEKESDAGDSSTRIRDGHEGSNRPITTEKPHALPNVPAREMNSQERDSAISRYKEKRKTRRYDKHIRYESRKVRAESRVRINGRFAKMANKGPPTR